MTELKDTVALMESDDFEIYPYWMIRLLFSWIEKLPSSDKSKLAVIANQSQLYEKRKKHGKIAPKKYLKELTAG